MTLTRHLCYLAAVLLFVTAASLGDATAAEWIRLGPGEFMMGSETGDPDERPVHRVVIERPFEIMRHETKLGAFRRFVRQTGYRPKGPCRYYTTDGPVDDNGRSYLEPGFPQTDAHPVVCVSIDDVLAYARWLEQTSGHRHRLPSEAEWEYAARAGVDDWLALLDAAEICRFANVSDRDRARAHADGSHYFGNERMYRTSAEQTAPCHDAAVFTAPVGGYEPNRFGLYDMVGNVWEWVADCAAGEQGVVPRYVEGDTSAAAVRETGCSRSVIRGGAWHTGPRYARLANRSSGPSENRMYHIGFRLVREVEETLPEQDFIGMK